MSKHIHWGAVGVGAALTITLTIYAIWRLAANAACG